MRARLLRRRCLTLLRQLKSRLDAIDSSEFPTPTGSRTSTLLSQLLDEINLRLGRAEDPPLLFLAGQLLDSLDYEIGYLESSRSTSAPRTVSLIVELLNEALKLPGSFLIAPNDDRNYSVQDIAGNLAQMTTYFLDEAARKRLFGDPPAPVYVVSFSRTSRDDVLLHAVLGHELGHQLADRFINEDQKTAEFSRETERALEAVKALVEAEMGLDEIEKLDRIEEQFDEVERARDRAVQELVSDLVGVHVCGLSSLFALHEFLSFESYDDIPSADEYYPPFRCRVRYALTFLEKAGHLEVLEKLPSEICEPSQRLVTHLSDAAADNGDLDLIRSEPILRIAYEAVEKALVRAQDFVAAELAAARYDARLVESEVPDLLARLRLSVPPNEMGCTPGNTPVDWRSALLAGWICFHHATLTDGSPFDAERVTDLTKLAIEYTSIHSSAIARRRA